MFGWQGLQRVSEETGGRFGSLCLGLRFGLCHRFSRSGSPVQIFCQQIRTRNVYKRAVKCAGKGQAATKPTCWLRASVLGSFSFPFALCVLVFLCAGPSCPGTEGAQQGHKLQEVGFIRNLSLLGFQVGLGSCHGGLKTDSNLCTCGCNDGWRRFKCGKQRTVNIRCDGRATRHLCHCPCSAHGCESFLQARSGPT